MCEGCDVTAWGRLASWCNTLTDPVATLALQGHVHAADIVDLYDRGLFANVARMLLVHFSARYHGTVRQCVQAELPGELLPKVALALAAEGIPDGSPLGQFIPA
jgi:hypothetical protein